jgi:hypothetical protein
VARQRDVGTLQARRLLTRLVRDRQAPGSGVFAKVIRALRVVVVAARRVGRAEVLG